jgi:hypothetical protein
LLSGISTEGESSRYFNNLSCPKNNSKNNC